MNVHELNHQLEAERLHYIANNNKVETAPFTDEIWRTCSQKNSDGDVLQVSRSGDWRLIPFSSVLNGKGDEGAVPCNPPRNHCDLYKATFPLEMETLWEPRW